AYELSRDWSSDVCSSDLARRPRSEAAPRALPRRRDPPEPPLRGGDARRPGGADRRRSARTRDRRHEDEQVQGELHPALRVVEDRSEERRVGKERRWRW